MVMLHSLHWGARLVNSGVCYGVSGRDERSRSQ